MNTQIKSINLADANAMTEAVFADLLRKHHGATEMLNAIVNTAKAAGYQQGFDAGFVAASEGDSFYEGE